MLIGLRHELEERLDIRIWGWGYEMSTVFYRLKTKRYDQHNDTFQANLMPFVPCCGYFHLQDMKAEHCKSLEMSQIHNLSTFVLSSCRSRYSRQCPQGAA